MLPSPNGEFVLASDCEALQRRLTHVQNAAAECFKQIEAQKITVKDAETLLRVLLPQMS